MSRFLYKYDATCRGCNNMIIYLAGEHSHGWSWDWVHVVFPGATTVCSNPRPKDDWKPEDRGEKVPF